MLTVGEGRGTRSDMDMMTAAGVPEGWVVMPTKAFGTHVGPFYTPVGGGVERVGFVADGRHGNKRGVVHGGMIATAFDVALGNASWVAAGQKPSATVQLNVHYLGAVKLGDFAEIAVTIVKKTRTLVFIRGLMMVGGEAVASADGVWKILAWREDGKAVPTGLGI